MNTKEKEQIVNDIKAIIGDELSNCVLSGKYPQLCSIASVVNGYNRIETQVIALMEETGISVRSALAQVESTYEV